MSLFIQDTEDRSELQKRIAAELSAKAKKQNIDLDPKDVDGVDDSAYIKDLEKSKVFTLAPTWWVLIALTIVTVASIIKLTFGGN